MPNTRFDTVCILLLVAMVLGFAAYMVHLGHNGTIIASVFAFVGAAAGYVYGKKTSNE